MNIFLAGIHGVGKSFLAHRIPESIQLCHVSASALITEERSKPNWGTDKRVTDPLGNQALLAKAVKRKNDSGAVLLLDGHFVLKGSNGEFISLAVDVFSPLNLKAVVLLEAPPQIIAQRIFQRDGLQENIEKLEKFLQAERLQAQKVCGSLKIPLKILSCPTTDEFIRSIKEPSSPIRHATL